jgi:hypothetical protein
MNRTPTLVLIVLCALGALTLVSAATAARALPGQPAAAAAAQAPSAASFAQQFLSLANAYAQANRDAHRFSRADCVSPARGRYMCSYATTNAGQREQCHIMQAKWTPNAASTFTITLSGRTARCGSLREALRSLR